MSKILSFPKTIILFSIIFVIISVIGCGPSKEHQQMTSFMVEYNQAVDTYIELSKQTDANGIAEAKAKVESFQSQWSDMKIEIGSEVTPQVLNELDDEFHAITKKFKAISASA